VKIVVGYISTPEGKAALDAAILEARLRDASLVVVRSMRGGARDEAEQSLQYQDEMEAVEAHLENEGVRYATRQLVRGQSPADDLLETAREEDAALIVIGLRRRSPVGKLVLGSNAQDVLLGADCPVLAVKPTA
jgi:nucleotide-binding universal stress UspA family protein